MDIYQGNLDLFLQSSSQELIKTMNGNPQFIQELAQLALHNTDHHTKQAAEAQLQNYIFSLSLSSQDFDYLFERHSDTVVLATAAKLAQNVSKIDGLGLYLDRVNKIFRSWFNPNDGRFTRGNGRALERYCVNTIGLFLGRSLKHLFQEKGNEKMVLNWLKMPDQGDKYRLYLFLTFIENVSLIDGSMTFVNYKILLQSFQQEVIPEMFAYIYPYFINFSEDIDVAGLSALQGRLDIRDQHLLQKDQQQSKTFTQFSFNIFQLLEEIITFKYNINFKQFDENEDLRGTISFPESVIKQIVKKDFLEALYTIINRLLEIPSAESYLKICLECLQKILSAKNSHIPKAIIYKFKEINLKGIVDVLDSIIDKNVGSASILLKVVDCNSMFVDIFGICEIKDLSQLDLKCQEYLQRWITRIFSLPILIMSSGQPLNADNELFLASTKVMQKMGVDLSSLQIQYNLPIVKTCYQSFASQFFSIFLVNSNNILGEVAFKSLEEFKRISMTFFEDVISLLSANYLQVFRGMNQLLTNLYAKITQNQVNIGNLLLLLTSMLQSPLFFELSINRNFLFEQSKGTYKYPEQIKALAQLLCTVFQFIATYASTNQYFSIHINNSLILFYEAFLTRFVKETRAKGTEDDEQMGNQIQIKDKVYLVIKEYMGLNDDQFLLQGLIGLSKLIPKSEATCIEYIFSCLHGLIAKIKRKFIRQTFKSTDIYREMLILFNNLIASKFNHQFIRWRVLLFKTVSLLCFDDGLDDYRSNIRNAIALIKNSSEQDLDRVLYDLIGICDGIESGIIFEYFISKMLTQMDYMSLLTKLYEKLGRRQALLKDILHLTYLLIQKKDGIEVSAKTYEIIDLTLPFWNHVLERNGHNEERIQLFEQIYLIERCLIEEGHINLAVVDQKSPVELRKFIYFSISHMKFFIDHVENYPQQIKSFYELIDLYFVRLKHLLYNHEQNELGLKLTELLYRLMEKLVLEFENIITQAYNASIFQYMLQTLDKFFKYVQDSKDFIHRRMYTDHLPSLLTTNEEKIKFIMHIFMLGLHFGNRKELETIRLLTNMALNLCKCYNFDSSEMAERIGIQNSFDRSEFIRIVSYIKEGKESDWIFFQLQDWFKNDNRFLQNVSLCNAEEGY